MKTHIRHDLHKRRRWLHGGVALLSIALTQCEWKSHFWEECPNPMVACGSSAEDGAASASDMERSTDQTGSPELDMSVMNPSLGLLRKLEWRAAIPLDTSKPDASKMKFVGMRGPMPVFWAKDAGHNPRWAVFQTDLLQTEVGARISPGNVPTMDFPPASKISGLEFADTELLVSSRMFVRLWDKPPSISYLDSGNEVLAGAAFVDPKKYFRDPEVDRFAVSVKPTQSGATSAVLLRWDAMSATTAQSNFPVPTALVMGDLDAADPAKNGIDVILFEGAKVQRVLHQGVGGVPSYPDKGLESGLQAVLERLEGSASITAGCITDLNGDGKTDLVIARGAELYVSSYLGREGERDGRFQEWSRRSVLTVANGQTVRSVSAVQLAGDSFPELVVETDKEVHFLLNNP